MTAIDLIRRLHEHRMWVNQRLLDAVKQLSIEQLQQSFPIGQGSVWKTLTHLLAAEFVWLEALLGNETPVLPGDLPNKLPGNQEGDHPIVSMKELVSRWKELDQHWQEYLSSMTEKSIDETVYKVSTSSGLGKRLGTKRSDILLHLCTHAQYTTAQLVNMLRQLGQSDLPDVMLITLARQIK